MNKYLDVDSIKVGDVVNTVSGEYKLTNVDDIFAIHIVSNDEDEYKTVVSINDLRIGNVLSPYVKRGYKKQYYKSKSLAAVVAEEKRRTADINRKKKANLKFFLNIDVYGGYNTVKG